MVDGPDIAAGAKNAPGSAAISDLINTIGFYAIVACLVGLLLSGLILAIGPRLGFTQASTIGKVGIFAVARRGLPGRHLGDPDQLLLQRRRLNRRQITDEEKHDGRTATPDASS